MRATRSIITILPLGGYTMRSLIFSIAVLFLAACADPDNPVVYTAPAGKLTQQPKQPPGTNSSVTIRDRTIELPIYSSLTGEDLSRYLRDDTGDDSLYGSFIQECEQLRSASAGVHDYSLFDFDGRRIQARNGWRWVYTYGPNGVTGSRPKTVDECARDKLSQRVVFCDTPVWENGAWSTTKKNRDLEGNEWACDGI